MRRYRLAHAARRDLEDIWDYIAEDSTKAATAHIELIVNKFVKLADNPKLGRARSEIRDGLRSLAVKNHVIFYREIDDVVEIVRVLSGYRDLANQFH